MPRQGITFQKSHLWKAEFINRKAVGHALKIKRNLARDGFLSALPGRSDRECIANTVLEKKEAQGAKTNEKIIKDIIAFKLKTQFIHVDSSERTTMNKQSI